MKDLIDLCLIPGVSGREEKVRKKIIEMVDGYEYSVDDIGNLTIEVGNGKETIMMMAHMDEIGFYISNVRKDGKLVIRKVGGISDELLPGRHVEVIIDGGNMKIDGVIGNVPPHLAKDGVIFEPIVDVGADNPEEVKKMGINILDFVVFKKHTSIIKNEFLSMRALDDRFGCYALIEVLRKIKPKKHVIFSWTVQEEIGLKGAKALANKYKPNIVYAIDAFACCSKRNNQIRIGNGPVLRMIDNSAIASFAEMEHILKVAKLSGIPIQVGTTGGGTDGSVYVEHGVRMVPITLAVKYMHSEVETISIKDLENLIKLLTALASEETTVK